MPRRARPDRPLAGSLWSGSDRARLPMLSAVGGDVGVPGAAAGDDGVQVPQDRRRDHGLRLGRAELVLLAGGQVSVSGGVEWNRSRRHR
jgi:hypothetical protein